MAKFIKNAVMLYRLGGETEIEGKMVECKMFDQDSPTFEEDSSGWVTHGELTSGDGDTDAVKKPRRVRPPKVEE